MIPAPVPTECVTSARLVLRVPTVGPEVKSGKAHAPYIGQRGPPKSGVGLHKKKRDAPITARPVFFALRHLYFEGRPLISTFGGSA
jgi:hypothetical protein